MFTSKCYTPFTSDLDVMIGAPLSENYRIARCGTMEVATLDGLEAIFMGGAYKHVGMLCKNSKIAKVNTDVQDAPVSAVERRRRRPPPIALPFIYIYVNKQWKTESATSNKAIRTRFGNSNSISSNLKARIILVKESSGA